MSYSFKDWVFGKPIPELAKLSKDERKRIWRKYYLRSFRKKWHFWITLMICGGCGGLGAGLGSILGGIWCAIGAGIGGGIGGGIFGCVAYKVTRSCIREDYISKKEGT